MPFWDVKIAVESCLHNNFNFKITTSTRNYDSFKFKKPLTRSLHDNFKIEKAPARRFLPFFNFKKTPAPRFFDNFNFKKANTRRFLPFFKIEKAPARRFLPFFKIISPVKLNIYAISTLKLNQKPDSGLILNFKRGKILVATDVLNLKQDIFLKLHGKSILKNVRQQELCPVSKLFLS